MKTVHCTIHDLDFVFPDGGPPNHPFECPYCLQDEKHKLRLENEKLREQRDALLAAFDVKRTVTITEGKQP